MPLLSVENLTTYFAQEEGMVRAVDGVSFAIQPGETFALVGESGSGKSVTALSVLRLLPQNAHIVSGRVLLNGKNLFALTEADMGRVRGKRIAMIFQDPMTSLNPVMKIGEQIGEVLKWHQGFKERALKGRAIELLDQVGIPLPEQRYDEYPHQLSGGMRQRVMIAIALAGEPDLLIADEPTTALDVTIQAQILKLLKSIQQRTGMALWLITHDLGIVEEMADHIAVMQTGQIVERAERKAFFSHPKHPYTRKLFEVLPSMDSCLHRQAARNSEPLLQVEDFKVYYPIHKGLFKRVVDHVRAVDGVSFSLEKGKTLALVGESGCGKTTLGKGLLDLIPNSGGQVRFDGLDLNRLNKRQRRKRCSAMQIIFQDPFSSMNPRWLVGDIIEEGMKALAPQMSALERRERVEDLLEQVGLPAQSRLRYPHEFSGGQRQRICIARALAVNPRLIVCDEPTSALDVSVQAQIIQLLKRLQQEDGLSYLFISHDLAVVAELADQVAVMYQGKIVEVGNSRQVLQHPEHPYTRSLLAAVPRLNTFSRHEIALN